MSKVYSFAIIFVLLFQTLSFAQQKKQTSDSIQIVTYYPSPYGSYNQLNVGAGGLRLAKVVDKANADQWTDLDVLPIPSGVFYIISVIPLNGDPFVTEMLIFAVGPQGASGGVMERAVANSYPYPPKFYLSYPKSPSLPLKDQKPEYYKEYNNYYKKAYEAYKKACEDYNKVYQPYLKKNQEMVKQWEATRNISQYRVQKLDSSDSFVLQIKPTKDCKVNVGKILSYWPDNEK